MKFLYWIIVWKISRYYYEFFFCKMYVYVIILLSPFCAVIHHTFLTKFVDGKKKQLVEVQAIIQIVKQNLRFSIQMKSIVN